MPGAIHDLKRIKVQYMWGKHFLITFNNGKELWTNAFSIVREEYEKSKPSDQLNLFE